MEKLLSLIEFNKIKSKLLSKMMDLEINNKVDTREYQELLNNYRLTCEVYNKKIISLSETDKKDLITNLNTLNPKLLDIPPLHEILEQNSNYLVLLRTILDLTNHNLLNFYQNKNQVENLRNRLYKILGLEEEKETEENSYAINSYMNQDFINLLFLVIDSHAKDEYVPEFKSELLNWKYSLVLLFSIIENRILITNFSIPETIKLVDTFSIEAMGITVEDYIKSFDSTISTIMMNIVNRNLLVDNKNNFDLELIFFETLTKLLNDKEYVSIIELELRTYIDNKLLSSINLFKAQEFLEVINQNLNVINNKENRRYIKI